MRRALLLVAALLFAAARFATLSIEPYGDSVLDLETGVTTLPQGGVIYDSANDVSIDAGYIEYVEDAYIVAKQAKMATEKVRIEAEKLRYVPEREEVVLEGKIVFDSDQLKGLEAGRGWVDLEHGVAVVSDGVRAASPELEAARLVAAYRDGEVLLFAPYRYRDEKLGATLKGTNPEKPLYLKFDLETGEVSASSRVPDEVRQRLLPYAQQDKRFTSEGQDSN